MMQLFICESAKRKAKNHGHPQHKGQPFQQSSFQARPVIIIAPLRHRDSSSRNTPNKHKAAAPPVSDKLPVAAQGPFGVPLKFGLTLNNSSSSSENKPRARSSEKLILRPERLCVDNIRFSLFIYQFLRLLLANTQICARCRKCFNKHYNFFLFIVDLNE